MPSASHRAAPPFRVDHARRFRARKRLDVLVEFEEGHTPGWNFFGMQDELTGIIGRKVDLNTPGFLSRYFRDRVLVEAVPIYESCRH